MLFNTFCHLLGRGEEQLNLMPYRKTGGTNKKKDEPKITQLFCASLMAALFCPKVKT